MEHQLFATMRSYGMNPLGLSAIPLGDAKQFDVANPCADMLYFFGFVDRVLADSVRWGIVAKTLIFVPLAISFVGAAVIWRNIFAGGGIEAQQTINGVTPSYQIGLLKALLGHTAEYNEPLYNLKFWGNFFLMWILVWVQTGFAMVIFSAALRGVPQDTIEAATIDGANPFQLFFRVKLPQIYSPFWLFGQRLSFWCLRFSTFPMHCPRMTTTNCCWRQ